MQQIMYQQSPWIVIAYPDDLEAYNTAKWTGWTQMFGGTGPAFNCEGNYDTYLNLQPKTAATGGCSGATAVIVAVAAGVVVVAVVVRDGAGGGRPKRTDARGLRCPSRWAAHRADT